MLKKSNITLRSNQPVRPLLAAFLLLVACSKSAEVSDLSKNHLLLRWSETEDKQHLTFTLPTISGGCRAAGASVEVSAFYDWETFEMLSMREATRCEGVVKRLVSRPSDEGYAVVGTYAKD